MQIEIRRIYDLPKRRTGKRILVDRLWPRGVKKEKSGIDAWYKEFAPSTALRTWFHEDKEKRFGEFKKKYLQELRAQKAAIKKEMKVYGTKLTLVTAVKDIELSHLPILQKFLGSL
jgi:uncharacterized protein YeaO (DUF488 family)